MKARRRDELPRAVGAPGGDPGGGRCLTAQLESWPGGLGHGARIRQLAKFHGAGTPPECGGHHPRGTGALPGWVPPGAAPHSSPVGGPSPATRRPAAPSTGCQRGLLPSGLTSVKSSISPFHCTGRWAILTSAHGPPHSETVPPMELSDTGTFARKIRTPRWSESTWEGEAGRDVWWRSNPTNSTAASVPGRLPLCPRRVQGPRCGPPTGHGGWSPAAVLAVWAVVAPVVGALLPTTPSA